MKLLSIVILQPILIFLFLKIGALLLPVVVIPWWYHTIQNMKTQVDLNVGRLHSGLLSEINNTAKLLHPINSSATNLARILTSSLNGTAPLSQLDVDTRVVPELFQALSTIPYISQISYIGLQGPFFAFYLDGNKTYAIYSKKSTTFSNSSNVNPWINCTLYKQPIDPDTGKGHGDASEFHANILANASWIREALTSTYGHASIGNGWNSAHDLLLINSVSLLGQGVISLGFPVDTLIYFFDMMDTYDGSLYLATSNGDVLAKGLPNTRMVIAGNSVSFELTDSSSDQISVIGKVSCIPSKGGIRPSILGVGEVKYTVYCSQLEIMGVQFVYAIALPYHGFVSTVDRSTKLALILLIIMIIVIFISVLISLLLTVRAASREIFLCSSLIKQMEATQQAERKSMNKTLAFANASHDIRASLAGITGLVEISYGEVSPHELQKNLQQIGDCAKDLVGLLNSVLDASKIEAGKMQVESEEFDLASLLEDVVDLFHPVGMKKDVDVVLDPCDGSALKFSLVKGDRGKLKQVLCNLLSNAVKFTSEGHVSVRAWVRKPSLEDKIIASGQKGLWKHCRCWLMQHKENNNKEENMNSMKQSVNSMEFVFEVDDTGKGIPKDNHESVFENFVQVKETALGQGGTGLGLGIVQSLVRLMGGEIGIVDKEKGTCFRFNTFLITSENPSTSYTRGDVETGRDSESNNPHQSSGLTIKAPIPSLASRTGSPRLSILGSSPKTDGSHVVLLIQNMERQRIVQKYIESLGIKVSVVSKQEHLSFSLTQIKSKQNASSYSSSGKPSDLGSWNETSSRRTKQDETEQKPSFQKGVSSFVLLVIDASTGSFEQLHGSITEFKRGLNHGCCKVVWLDKPTSRSIGPRGGLKAHLIDSDDEILLKPLHGSRLYQIIKYLPEFGGSLQNPGKKAVKDPTSSSSMHLHGGQRSEIQTYQHPLQEQNTGVQNSFGKEKQKKTQNSNQKQEKKISDECNDKPLSGLRILVAEDNKALSKIAERVLSQLGAYVSLCQNGDEALQLVRCGLPDQRKYRSYPLAPCDYILMDCEMPIMNGYEATRQIRIEERLHDIHIPIIALTADDKGEKVEEAGMDLHLTKPLAVKNLLEAIGKIQANE